MTYNLCGAQTLSEANNIDSLIETAIELPDDDAEIQIKVGDLFYYSSEIHPSVGDDYYVKYKKSKFEMIEKRKYKYGYHPMMAGGDSGTRTCLFKALKKGSYTIKVIHDFRGEVICTITYKIIVK